MASRGEFVIYGGDLTTLRQPVTLPPIQPTAEASSAETSAAQPRRRKTQQFALNQDAQLGINTPLKSHKGPKYKNY